MCNQITINTVYTYHVALLYLHLVYHQNLDLKYLCTTAFSSFFTEVSNCLPFD